MHGTEMTRRGNRGRDSSPVPIVCVFARTSTIRRLASPSAGQLQYSARVVLSKRMIQDYNSYGMGAPAPSSSASDAWALRHHVSATPLTVLCHVRLSLSRIDIVNILIIPISKDTLTTYGNYILPRKFHSPDGSSAIPNIFCFVHHHRKY